MTTQKPQRFDIAKMPEFTSDVQLKKVLQDQYMRQIENYFGDPKKALAFLSAVSAAVQRTPDLVKCTPISVMNSFLTMAQLGFMPSSISGEAFVLPYKNKGVLEAQFQLGYQGLVTLLYAAGAKSVVAELVREKDVFTLINGKIHHEVSPLLTKEQRGDAIGAYAIIMTANGGTVEGFMRMEDILAHAKKFSKSYGGQYSPWNPESDPEGWMPRKTILKQVGKLAPKNERLNIAIALDNKDSIIGDRLNPALEASQSLTMGALALSDHGENKSEDTQTASEESEGGAANAESTGAGEETINIE